MMARFLVAVLIAGAFDASVVSCNKDDVVVQEMDNGEEDRDIIEGDFSASSTRYTFPGRPVLISTRGNDGACGDGEAGISYRWTVNGKAADWSGPAHMFTPDGPGEYVVTVTACGHDPLAVKVICVDASEEQRFRRATASSSAMSTRVYEWRPAPGQFIGELHSGISGPDVTAEQARRWAEDRLEAGMYVSLGGFGGYIIVGFDHSVPCGDEGYDFSVTGNAFFNAQSGDGGSNEPGIVYVMQDVNGNGLPDDEWYELRGSDTGKAGTVSDYAVTYYRPEGPKMAVKWTDSLGESGEIDYIGVFHAQDYYYPLWIEEYSYTLCGTRLKAQTDQDPDTCMWNCHAFGWGYCDNMGSDRIADDDSNGSGHRNGFRISNAMHADGSAVKLRYVDFIKVQTGVNSKAGILGEVSTEVFGFRDLSL